ncbi:MAG: MerR family transcriptional regulator [Nocardioidaceae bacterium]|nr:MerR family transcriptional regulator [Nocardioidaceae bacterium]
MSGTLRASVAAGDAVRPSGPLTGLLWGIGAVATRTGIPAATLRNWDRRYGVGPSAHSEGGHRRYDESDVACLSHMATLMAGGAAVLAASEIALDARAARA